MARRAAELSDPGGRVLLHEPAPGDRREFLAFVEDSRELHVPWVYPPADRLAYGAYLRRLRDGRHAGFLVRVRDTGALAGVVNLNEIVRGSFQNAYLGFYAARAETGRGYMTEAVRLLLGHAFSALGLHRVEADVQPGNERSLALVRRCGFRFEGVSPRLLHIGGRWRDHERWALLADHGDVLSGFQV